jgi:hypothetical protein
MMFHRHKWRIRGTKTINYTGIYDGIVYLQKTRVLKVCTVCGKTKVKEIDGHWTKDQLNA